MKCRHRLAFTLIELLVVVFIIMLLGTIMFPALQKMRESARGAQCDSNLRQLQVACVNFAADHQWLPQNESFWHDNGDGSWSHWHGWVAWYDKTTPTADNVTGSKPGNGQDAWFGNNAYISVTNGAIWGYINNPDVYGCPSFKASSSICKVSNPIRTYTMSDASGGQNMLGLQGATTMMFCDDKSLMGNVTANVDAYWSVSAIGNDLGTWHSGKGNIIFVDGHIERR